jgi:hypothetical protein
VFVECLGWCRRGAGRWQTSCELLGRKRLGLETFGVPTVAASVDLVVHVGTDASGRRRVREIVALPGRAENGVIETVDGNCWSCGWDSGCSRRSPS